jgi:hypothetical protein
LFQHHDGIPFWLVDTSRPSQGTTPLGQVMVYAS